MKLGNHFQTNHGILKILNHSPRFSSPSASLVPHGPRVRQSRGSRGRCWPLPRHTHAHPVASKRPPVSKPGHYVDAHPDLFVRRLPVLSDGMGVCV
jgi:hypothetical protein